MKLATLELLRLHFPRLERALLHTNTFPIRFLVEEKDAAELRRARGVTATSLFRSILPRNLRRASAAELEAYPQLTSLRAHVPIRVGVAKRREATDAYENRVILHFLRWLDRQITNTVLVLERPQPELEASVRQAWITRLRGMKARLRELLALSFLRGVTEQHVVYRPSPGFRRHPAYMPVYQAIRAIRSGLDSEGGEHLSLPVDRTYRLFEIWCYIRLVRALAEEFPEFELALATLFHETERDGGLGVYLAGGGTVAINLGNHLRLVYQREYTPEAYAAGSAGTSTSAMKPDFSLEVSPAVPFVPQDLRAIILVDPKYRTGPALFDAMRAVHTYRDAIVGPQGERIVLAAVVLTPHRPTETDDGTPNAWRNAKLPDRLFFKSFRTKHRIGAVYVRPGVPLSAFRELAREIVSLVEP